MTKTELEILGKIPERFREYGTIKTALFFTDKSPPESKNIEEAGYTIKVFPPVYSLLSMSLEIYDRTLFDDFDIVILLIKTNELLTLMSEIRSKVDLLILISPDGVEDIYRNLVDDIVPYSEIEHYTIDDLSGIEDPIIEMEQQIDAESNYIDQITTPSKISNEIDELSLTPVSEIMVDAEEDKD